jgi:hypothetical protein
MENLLNTMRLGVAMAGGGVAGHDRDRDAA